MRFRNNYNKIQTLTLKIILVSGQEFILDLNIFVSFARNYQQHLMMRYSTNKVFALMLLQIYHISMKISLINLLESKSLQRSQSNLKLCAPTLNRFVYVSLWWAFNNEYSSIPEGYLWDYRQVEGDTRSQDIWNYAQRAIELRSSE